MQGDSVFMRHSTLDKTTLKTKKGRLPHLFGGHAGFLDDTGYGRNEYTTNGSHIGGLAAGEIPERR